MILAPRNVYCVLFEFKVADNLRILFRYGHGKRVVNFQDDLLCAFTLELAVFKQDFISTQGNYYYGNVYQWSRRAGPD